MNGTSDQDAEQAVDHRGHAGQEADDRLQDVAHPLGRELDDEDGDEERGEEGDQDGAAGDQQRAPDQRPGVEGVDVFGAGLAGEEDRVELVVDVAAGAEPGEAVVGERRPGADEDGDDHRQQQPDDGADQRAEHPLDALVRPLAGRTRLVGGTPRSTASSASSCSC